MKKRIFILSVVSSLLALAFVASSALATHEHPVGASPVRVPLVPAFEACNSANSTHGAPLVFPSCNPPVPVSGTVKSGTGSIGYASVLVCNTGAAATNCHESAPGFTTAMQPDVRVWGVGRDVQCRLTGTPTGCVAGSDYSPNGAAGPYTTVCTTAAGCGNGGKPTPFCAPGAGSAAHCTGGADITATAALAQAGSTIDPTAQCGSDPTCLLFTRNFVGHAIRVTDHYNCSSSLPPGDPNACPASSTTSTRPATMIDILFPIPVDCIANPEAAVAGSNCGANTTANALVPGSVIKGKQAVVEIGEVQDLDSGPNGTRGDSDDERFAVQGIYLP